MSSTLTVTNLTATNLTDGGGTTSTFANVTSGIAKAWIKLNMSAASINNSFNISSASDTGAGDFEITVTNVFSSDAYVTTGSNYNSSRGNQVASALTASVFELDQYDDAANRSDSARTYCTAHGDLA